VTKSQDGEETARSKWVRDLFPPAKFGTDAKGLGEAFEALKGVTYYEVRFLTWTVLGRMVRNADPELDGACRRCSRFSSSSRRAASNGRLSLPSLLRSQTKRIHSRSQPFVAQTLVFNSRSLVESGFETDLWICRDVLAATITTVSIVEQGEEEFEERFLVELSSVERVEVVDSPEGDEGTRCCPSFWKARC
jgi:hypothetical protein